MALATIIFFISLVGLAGLFGFKHWENGREQMPWQDARRRIDERAHRTKEIMLVSAIELEKLPPYLLHVMRISIQRGAISFGYLAHWLGRRSHALADLVSHKHRFQRKETNSEFLKKVIEHPMKPENGRVNAVYPVSAQKTIQDKISLAPTHASTEGIAVESHISDISTAASVEGERSQGNERDSASPMTKEQQTPRHVRRVGLGKMTSTVQKNEISLRARKRKDVASLGENSNV